MLASCWIPLRQPTRSHPASTGNSLSFGTNVTARLTAIRWAGPEVRCAAHSIHRRSYQAAVFEFWLLRCRRSRFLAVVIQARTSPSQPPSLHGSNSLSLKMSAAQITSVQATTTSDLVESGWSRLETPPLREGVERNGADKRSRTADLTDYEFNTTQHSIPSQPKRLQQLIDDCPHGWA